MKKNSEVMELFSRLKIFNMMREYDTVIDKNKKLNEILLYHLDNSNITPDNLQLLTDLLNTYGGRGTIRKIKEAELKRAIEMELSENDLDLNYEGDDEDED